MVDATPTSPASLHGQPEYRVEAYDPGHRSAVIRLHQQLMPRRHGVNEAYFRWKYERNPYLPMPHLALVFDRGDLVAMRGMYGTRWLDPGGAGWLVPHADDLIVAPVHRSRGLFVVLDKELRRQARSLECDLMISISGGRTTQDVSLATGWSAVDAVDRLVRPAPRRRQPIGGAIVRRGVGVFKKVLPLGGFRNIQAPSPRMASRVLSPCRGVSARISRRFALDPRELSRLAGLRSRGGWYQERSEDFYRWRFDNPDRTYGFITWSDDRLRGFLAVALMPHDPQRVKIVDVGFDDPEVLIEMIAALATSPFTDIEVMISTVSTISSDELSSMGFVDARMHGLTQTRTFLARGTTRRQSSVPQRNWDYDLIDTMLA